MNILLLTTKFPVDPESPYLSNEICEAFAARGDSVTVVNIDWHNDNGGSCEQQQGNVLLYNVARLQLTWLPRIFRLPIVWLMSSAAAYFKLHRRLCTQNFDVCLLTTPMTVFTLFLFLGRRFLKCRWVALCWDFFPSHQVKLGLIPRVISPALHFIEEAIYSRCSRICVLSDDYRTFLEANYRISADIEVVTTGLWGGPLDIPDVSELFDRAPDDLSKTIVFGGQLAEGRGLVNFIRLCKISAAVDPALRILVIGNGNLLSRLESDCSAQQIKNIVFENAISRARYVVLIGNCMAGFVSLDDTLGCPSFPSKLVDYMRAGLPVVVMDCLNPAIKAFVTANKIGFYVHPEDDQSVFFAISQLAIIDGQREKISKNSRECFVRQFNVDRASTLILPS